MAPRITIVGGGSTHWTPRLLLDFANTPSLRDAGVTLVDIDAASLPPMVDFCARIAKLRDIGIAATATTDLAEGLDGAEFVITALSVGGFTSMRHDLEIPARYGLRQPVGDSVGPGGIARSLRTIPVMLGIAREMERRCPDALLVNVSNPLTALVRAVTRETSITAVGLCNELVGLMFVTSLLLDADMRAVDPVVGGVNHLPLVTELRVDGRADGFDRLRDLLADDERQATGLWLPTLPDAMHYRKVSPGPTWTKADVVAGNRLKLELFTRFGVLPGSSDTHVGEFFPGFVTEASDFGRDWAVHHYGLTGHMADKRDDEANAAELFGADEIPEFPSGELVAPLLDGLVSGVERHLPVNLPNTGQVTNLADGAVVECIGLSGAAGVRPRDTVTVPSVLGEYLRRIVVSQELTVDAAVTGDPTTVLEAMLTDQMTGRLPHEHVVAMTSELLAATKDWLPQFAR
ncbi:MAG: glycoside hydrolase family 4 [Acidimicrobiales bacterium]|jgi:alpha-galactosidase/6-phospho-beta-glucosidase family protein|nr:glycoside hydrolase family 4 [Acidimicrobiales bacterium]